MLEVTSSVKIDEGEIQLDFIHASGPVCQNVNKVASSVQLRFDVRNSPSLDPEIKERLIKLAGSRMTEGGILVIEAKRYRTQDRNRADAVSRLITLIQKALDKPRVRKPTRPSLAAKAARLGHKKKRAEIKRRRRFKPEEWE